jgi:guanylate kinase
MSFPPLLAILAGPSGSGKSTLCNRLVETHSGFKRVVTTTTRPPRDKEADGVDYHFFSPAEFTRRVDAGEFLEWAWVHGAPHEASERRYGTLKSSLLDPLQAGQDLVMSIDVQGVSNVREVAKTNALLRRSLVTIFILVDHERLMARMRHRGQDHEAEIARRMKTAEEEIKEAKRFDYVIESRSRDEDFDSLLSILDQARKKAS